MLPEIKARRYKGGASQIRKLLLILKADRRLQAALILIIVGGLLTGFSSEYIPPFVSHQTYTVQMNNYPHDGIKNYSPNLNLYAEAPNYPIYLNIDDSQHAKIFYEVYYATAIGYGTKTPIMNGSISSPYTITISNTVYQKYYILYLSAPNNTYFQVSVTLSQTVYQYPPANYYMLAPGIMAILIGMVLVGASFIRIHSDKLKYYSNLKLEDSEIEYLFKPSKQLGTLPWIGKIIIGFAFTALGFILFGNGFLLSWIGIVFILAGIAMMLNGVVQKMSTGRV
jgi:hypothetical protein